MSSGACWRCACLMICMLLAGNNGGRAQFVVNASVVGSSPELDMMYVRLSVENRIDREVKPELRLMQRSGNGRQEIQLSSQVFAPGAKREIHLAVPMEHFLQVFWKDPLTRKEQGNIANTQYAKYILHISGMESQATAAQIQAFSKVLGGSGMEDFVSQITPDLMPDDWRCYMPFRAVMLPEAMLGLLEPEAREKLLTWVRMGGELTLYRAEVESTERMHLGRVRRVGGHPLLDLAGADWGTERRGWRQIILQSAQPPYAIAKQAGKTGGLVLASLFFLVAGPVNYFWVLKKKRPHLLLKTVPLLSMGFCLLITVYFVATEGFARKGGTLTLALYDEETQHGAIIDRHQLISGLYPTKGFLFPEGTLFFPLQSFSEASWEMEFGAGQHLTSGLFQPRVPFDYTTVQPLETREKLIVNTSAGTVVNGYEQAIEGGLLRKGEQAWRIPALGKGQGGKLEPVTLNEDLIPEMFNETEIENLKQWVVARSGEMMSGTPLRLADHTYWLKFKGVWGGSRSGLELDGPHTVMLLARLPQQARPAREGERVAGL